MPLPKNFDSTIDLSHVSGNASEDIKRLVSEPMTVLYGTNTPRQWFGDAITARLKATEVNIQPKAEENAKKEVKLVFELTVEEDMLNGGGNMHGGCAAFLVDLCSSLVLLAYTFSETGHIKGSVSQSLNMVYHSPAPLGCKLRIVNYTMAVGARASSARTEIWDATHKRLVASGVHIKMSPSQPKTKL